MAKLVVFQPVKPFHINQSFGENTPCVKNYGTPNQSIVNGADNLTCPVGYEKLYAKFGMSGHNGTDLAAGEQPVYAACDGTVIEQQFVPARGLGVGILTDTPVDMECGTHFAKIRYWHFKSFTVKVGDHVTVGQQIGVSDNTGYSSGNHLHFELQPMDKDAGGHPFLTMPSGNIAGAVSIEPYLTPYFAGDKQKVVNILSQMIALLQALLTKSK